MNKKGFTLIEIIVCVSIIAVVAIVVGVNSEKIFGEDKIKEDAVTTVVSAAKIFTENNAGLVQPLYDDKGFVNVELKELVESGLIEQSVVDEYLASLPEEERAKSTSVVVTLNSDGFLDFDINENTEFGYLNTNDNADERINIAANDSFKCDYMVNEPVYNGGAIAGYAGLIFYNTDGSKIDTPKLETSINEVDENGDYYCEIPTLTTGENTITYTYQIGDLKRTKTRKINVLKPLEVVELAKSNFDLSEVFLFENKSGEYNLFKKSSSSMNFTLKSFVTDYDNYNKADTSVEKKVQLVYELVKGSTKIKSKTPNFSSLSTGEYTVNVYTTNKKRIYTDTELTTDATILNGTGTEGTPAASFKIKITNVNKPEITRVTYKDSSNNVVQPGDVREGKKVFVETNSTYVTKKYYKFSNPNETTGWKELTSNLITTPSPKIWIKVKDSLNQYSDPEEFVFNVRKEISKETTSSCEKNNSSDDTCYIKGNNENNYVSYGGKTWRIYKRKNGNMSLILNDSFKTIAYGQVGQCTSGCCNGGRYYYRFVGDDGQYYWSNEQESTNTDYSSSYGYQYKTINNEINDFYTTISNYNSNVSYLNLMETYTIYPMTNVSKTVKIGLLDKSDYAIVAKCTTNNLTGCVPNYIKQNKGEFWLVNTKSTAVGSGAYNRGSNAAYIYNYSVDSNGNIISTKGSVSAQGVYTVTTDTLGFRPTIQLSSTAKIISGTGAAGNPYVIGV